MRAGSALRARVMLVLVAMLAGTTVPLTASAAEPEASEAIETARYSFLEGTTHFQARRFAEALRSFEQSLSVVASPNTSLMIARCQRELGRRPEAAATYAATVADARARVARGETKYGPTADAAEKEGTLLRAQLGTLHVKVARPAGATLTIDRKPVALSADGDAVVIHDPGPVSVSVVDASGVEQRQTVTVVAAGTADAEFTLQAPAPKPPPPLPLPARVETGDRAWTLPAALVAGGVAAAALGVFIGFGLSSQSTFDDLERRCGATGCGPAERADADDGKRAQTIANVGLVTFAVAAVATAVFVVLGAGGDRPRRAAPTSL